MSVLKNTTCFKEHEKRNLTCKKKSCKYWLKHSSSKNCAIIASNTGEFKTLQQIGDMFGLTRMRICQIEKVALSKIKSLIDH